MKRALTMPLVTAVLALAGFGLRKWHLASAWEADTGFTIPGAPAGVAAWVFLVAAAAILALLAWKSGGRAAGYVSAFQTPMKLWTVLYAVAGGMTAAGGAFWLMERRTEGVLETVLAVAFVLSGAAMVCLGLAGRSKTEKRELAVALIPGYAACIWLVEVYQRHTANPEVMEYVFYLFGVVTAILALYTMAGFSFEKEPRARRFCWYASMAVTFLFTDLADGRGMAVSLVEAGTAVFLYVQLTVLRFRDAFPAALEEPERAEAPEASPAPEDTKDLEEQGGPRL